MNPHRHLQPHRTAHLSLPVPISSPNQAIHLRASTKLTFPVIESSPGAVNKQSPRSPHLPQRLIYLRPASHSIIASLAPAPHTQSVSPVFPAPPAARQSATFPPQKQKLQFGLEASLQRQRWSLHSGTVHKTRRMFNAQHPGRHGRVH